MGVNVRRSGAGLSAALTVCIALVATGCNGSVRTGVAIEKALAAAAESDSRIVDVSKVVPGDWTRLLFVCGYTSRELVEMDLGFPWPEFRDTEADSVHTWVFATSKQVVTWAVVKGYHGDPCFYSGPRPASVVDRRDAQFRVENTDPRYDAGRTFRVLRPVK